ncbi:MAG TPA: hypothetical protein PKI32_01875, partial [Opitutales bacterium]|nr:hypothetical protein [Opitutales bacterium]
MKTYKVHPVFDSDHALMIKAGSVKEAALVFLTNWPVRKNLVVSHGKFSEEVVNYEELAAEFPEVRQLLDSAPSQQPVPELAKAFAVAEKKSEKTDENWFAMKFV